MVFYRKDSVGIAFTVNRGEAGDTLRQEEARDYAMREFEREGIAPPDSVEIEAFENQWGWLVFCTVSQSSPYEVYIRFENENDFLDAVYAHGTNGVALAGWRTDGYTVRVSGTRESVMSYAALLCEYGQPFEAPQGFERHLTEQAQRRG